MFPVLGETLEELHTLQYHLGFLEHTHTRYTHTRHKHTQRHIQVTQRHTNELHFFIKYKSLTLERRLD